MIYLPDVNVWLALTVAEHIHHQAASEWLEAVSDDTIAFCRVTQMGFLRLLTNRRVMAGDVFSAAQAWRLLDRIHDDERAIFASEPSGFERQWRSLTLTQKEGANFWTDAYLAAFARVAGYTLVTFDRGFQRHKTLPVRILS